MRFPSTISRQSVVLALLVTAAVLSFMGARAGNYLRGRTQGLLAPLGDLSSGAATTIRQRADNLGKPSHEQERRVQDLDRQIQDLRYALHSEQARYNELVRAAQAKDSLYGQFPDFPCRLVNARVVSGESLPYGGGKVIRPGAPEGANITTRDLITDRSKSLPENLHVMDSKALVGRIIRAGEFTAQLQLITDPAFKTQAMIWRDPGISRQIVLRKGNAVVREALSAGNNELIDVSDVRGNGKGGLIVRNVFQDRNIQPGDWLITTGNSRFMPDRIRIGQVVTVQNDHDHVGMASLVVKPLSDLGSLREVFIVLPLAGNDGGGGR